jgi:ElaA protein
VGRVIEALTVRSAAFADLSPDTLYEVLRLRSEVFVVEQECVFLDLDGRDTEPDAVHLWLASDGVVIACARVLPDAGGGSSIGRVVTARPHRREGLGTALLTAALALAPRPVAINAQSRLLAWYADFGFAPDGDEFVEDGILHTPMVLR